MLLCVPVFVSLGGAEHHFGVEQRRASADGRRQPVSSPGEHSIDRNTPTSRLLKGREVIVLDWSIRRLSGRLIEDKRTQGRTATEVRRKAKATAQRLLASESGGSPWKATDRIERYLDEVSAQEVLDAPLRPDTRLEYQRLLKHLREQLAGHSIATAEVPDVLVTAIQCIAAEHGHETARQTQHFHAKYVAQPLRRHRLLDHDPIEGMSLDLRAHAPELTGPKRGGVAQSEAEQERLRLKEALAVRWTDIFYDQDGVMRVRISKDVSKTAIARQPAVLDRRVQARLEERRERARSDEEFVIGAPSNPSNPLKQWGTTGNGGASPVLATLSMKVAKKARAVHMDFQRTHLRRTTLNMRLKEAGAPRRTAPLSSDMMSRRTSPATRTRPTSRLSPRPIDSASIRT